MLDQSLRFLLIYMVQSQMPSMEASLMSDGEFYVIEVKIRKVVE